MPLLWHLRAGLGREAEARRVVPAVDNSQPTPRWWTSCVHLRTWLFETTDFYLPDLKSGTDHDGSMPEVTEAA